MSKKTPSSHSGQVKVCFLVTKGVWGGAQKYVYNLATSLPKDKYEIIVICGEGDKLAIKLRENGIKTITLKNLKRDISFIAEIKNFFRLLKLVWQEKPEILHLNSPKVAGLGALIGRILFINKIIFTVHGWTFNEKRGPVVTDLIRFFSWLTVIMSHRIIVLSQREKEQTMKMPWVRDSKVELIHNGIEKINFKEKEIAREKLLRVSSPEFRDSILWIGTISELHKNKGLKFLIETLSKVNFPFICVIIGEGEERKNLEDLIKKYNLEKKVFLVGFLERASEYLKSFDIFTLTSIKEGFPFTLLEAGQAGLPSIASSVGGIPEIINNESGILVAKGRVGEIVRALEWFANRPEERQEFGEKLKEKVEKEFSLEQMLEKTEKLYKN